MSTILRRIMLRQGTAAELAAITPALGEPCWTTDTFALYIGDGVTLGGVLVTTTAATLASLGAIFNARAAKSANYTALLADKGKLIDGTGTWTLSLTAAATLGSAWVLVVVNSGSGLITIDPNSTETILDEFGSATTKVLGPGESGFIFCDATGFFLIRANSLGLSSYNSQGGSYTLVIGDIAKTILMTSGSANALTIPPNSSVAFPVGTKIPGYQTGAGLTTLTAGAGVTLNSRGGALISAGRYSAFMLEKTATDTWLVSGDLVP